MYFFLVFSLVFSFQISITQAACGKMSHRLQTRSTDTTDFYPRPQTATTSSGPSMIATNHSEQVDGLHYGGSQNSSRNLVNQSLDKGIEFRTAEPSQPLALSDLNTFRLEYNKYKILSHLGITANTDNIASHLDDEVRSQLTSSVALVESLNTQTTATSVSILRQLLVTCCCEYKLSLS